MLRDGVCDEATNTEKCHWDGGDCCLDISLKDETLCQARHSYPSKLIMAGFSVLLFLVKCIYAKLSRIVNVNGLWILSSILEG